MDRHLWWAVELRKWQDAGDRELRDAIDAAFAHIELLELADADFEWDPDYIEVDEVRPVVTTRALEKYL